ncbi:TrkH family potassium uptake protein [Parasedimentitalea huanghaiensis]|uniref:TrkH family potassium uptake protein n=1 Tax=Parasedimentitalea huanghaiensis TaxID=2682100 RepID=A0A6L6WB01_9RHOB|nr:potassium transporter TrkG [Zongyanglinia huanghaiensis]MVO14438.1 TrkH family potassium uptake protein [Zongyanglinia huanghaiensis]
MARKTAPPGILRLPLFLLIFGIAALAMWVPAIHAVVLDDHPTSRSFFYSGIVGLMLVTFIGLSLSNRVPRYGMLGQLLSLLATFSVLPLFLAVPTHDALQNTSYLNAYFDMVSAITTTGADVFADPGRLPPSVHLWRAQVGWMGGLLMWIAASAVLAPLSLGGFEVTARGEPGRGTETPAHMQQGDPRRRLVIVTQTLVPIYVGLTMALWVLLMMTGEKSLIGLSHAMSVMATSGISAVGGLVNANSGLAGEMVIFLFMFFALSRLTFSTDTATSGHVRLDRDPEFRIGLILVIGVPLLLFLRHWLASFEVSASENLSQAFHSLWGGVFTVMSFLTTTGFESADWAAAQQWSGLGTPGLILLGLAVVGGGVATTAGGVKLLRVYALYLNGMREMERLVHPSSVSGEGAGNKRLQKNGAFVAWVFFMLFALTLALISTSLAALGSDFEQALVLAIAALSTTGPLIEVASETSISLALLAPSAKLVLCLAMVLGRLETLAIIALLTPNLWRN